MEIPQENTMENSGKQNPEVGFKSPPEQRCQPYLYQLLDSVRTNCFNAFRAAALLVFSLGVINVSRVARTG
jgi:hypothetical protein